MPATRGRESDSVRGEQASGAHLTDSLLSFNEPLSWKAGKAIPVADLLARLQKLSKELRGFEPEGEVDQKSFYKIAQELASPNLLAHKDRGVKAWAVCCVVDLLRICVPHAPFRNPQLKDIFTTVVSYIVPQLADASNAYHAQHIYVLNSLSDVHSIALITDLDRPEQLILSLFTTCFDIVSGSAKTSTGEEVSTAVQGHLTQILVQVIDESSSLSPELTDVIIAQFLRVDPRVEDRDRKEKKKKKKKDVANQDGNQSNLLQKTYPPAYEVAKAICNSVPEKMTTYISQYFNNLILDASTLAQANGHSGKIHGRRGDLGDGDDDGQDVKELGKAHRLIRELWRACPDVLQHVIPQVETELSAESPSLRLIATETLADIAAGIGVGGFPPAVHPDPAAFPTQGLASLIPSIVPTSILQTPMSPKPFAQTHTGAYESFLSRKQDKAPSVRAAWATGAGRILLTSAGGIGFAEGEEEKLKAGIAQLLADADEKVRLAAIKVIGYFGLADVISKLGSHGSISSPGSILATLSDRVRDRKIAVREEAMHVLSRMWAVAAGEIEHGNDEVTTILGDAPSKLLDTYYVNDPEVHALLDHVMFEYLLPLNYPPIKGKTTRADTQKQAVKEKSGHAADEATDDVDDIRVRRILTLLKGLDDRARKVFFAMQMRQTQLSRIMTQFLRACEEYNGGVVDQNEAEIQKELTKWVDAISRTLPEPTRVASDLRKFAKMHDRRNYQLIRFCLNPESEYRIVVKAIRELSKRIQSRPANSPSLDTITPLMYRCSLLIYNRSHVPGVMGISRSDETEFAEPAHELLKEISVRNPEVLKTHVQELCKDLETSAPTDSRPEEPSAADMLKACAEFARKFPAEVPKDRKFLVAMTNYALFSRNPRAAKHAVSIIMTGTEKKEMYAKDLIQKATAADCTHQTPHFLTRLATISQINLLEPKAADEFSDTIIRITTQETLLKNHHPSPSTSDTYTWDPNPSPETLAKEWSLKCLINFLRSHSTDNNDDTSSHQHHQPFIETATPIYSLLTRLITQEGELSSTHDTPPAQRSHLRLTAARFLLKLCSRGRACEDLVTPQLFNMVALVAQDRLPEVRAGFTRQLKKYLGQGRLNYRWYTVLLLSAFEPEKQLKNDTIAWLRSRAAAVARRRPQQQNQQGSRSMVQGQQNLMETLLARLLSLLAHHPDMPEADSETFNDELLDFAQYLIFYLQSIADEENLSLIFHVAQRVKQTQDVVGGNKGTAESTSERLYVLSDLAQVVVRHYADFLSSHHHQKGHGGSSSGGGKDVNLLQTWPGKLRLPVSLFKALPSHEVAQRVAERNFLPEEVAERLEGVVRKTLRPVKGTGGLVGSGGGSKGVPHRKRKSENRDNEVGGEEEEEEEGAGAGEKGDRKQNKRARKTTTGASSSSLPVRKATTTMTTTKKRQQQKQQHHQPRTPRGPQGKKRKSFDDDDDDDGDEHDDRATGSLPPSSATAPARKSSRKSGTRPTTNYADRDSDEDDEEMERWQKIAQAETGEGTGDGEDQPTTNGVSDGEDDAEAHNEDKEDVDMVTDNIDDGDAKEKADDDDSDGIGSTSASALSSPQASPSPLRAQPNGATTSTSKPPRASSNPKISVDIGTGSAGTPSVTEQGPSQGQGQGQTKADNGSGRQRKKKKKTTTKTKIAVVLAAEETRRVSPRALRRSARAGGA